MVHPFFLQLNRPSAGIPILCVTKMEHRELSRRCENARTPDGVRGIKRRINGEFGAHKK